MMSVFLDEDELDYREGKQILEDCESILEDLLVHEKLSARRILSMIRSHTGHQRSNYNDAINVCAYSGIFSQLLNFDMDECKEIALGGLLHNIGLAGIPTHLTTKASEELSEEEWSEYKLYPKRSIVMIKRRKVPLLEISTKCVEQSMERIDGSGFPRGSSGVAVAKHSRVVNIAIEFNKLTSMDNKGNFAAPRQAVAELLEKNQTSSSLDLRDLAKIAAENGEPKQISGKQELFENILNQYI